MNVDESDDQRDLAAAFAQLLKDMHFGETPEILPENWRLYFSVQCPSCGEAMYFDRNDTDPIDRHAWCNNGACIQSKSLYTIRISPYNCAVVGSEPRKIPVENPIS